MVDYCEGSGCRRKKILESFGEQVLGCVASVTHRLVSFISPFILLISSSKTDTCIIM